jgi:hypothetical protein
VPIARLAAAQAAIKDDTRKAELVEALKDSGKSYEEIIAFLHS